MQVVILVDKDTDTRIRTDVCRPTGLRLGKFLADEPLLDQHLAFQRAQLIDHNPIHMLSKLHIDIREGSIQHALNLRQLTEIGAPRKREPHQITRETHTAGEYNIAVCSLGAEPGEPTAPQELINCHRTAPPSDAPVHECDRGTLPPSHTPRVQPPPSAGRAAVPTPGEA